MPNASLARIPRYRRHKGTGQAVVTLNGKDHYLGKYRTAASRAAYDRLIAEWIAHGRLIPPSDASLTVNQVILNYWRWVEGYYRKPEGTPTSEAKNIRDALRSLKKLYGSTPAADFDSLALEALRQQMIGSGLCRTRINKDVSRLKRMFRWGAAKKLVPLEVHQSMQTVEGLRAGRSEAKESEPVRPVNPAIVESTLPYLRPQTRAMVQLQLLAGMRPGEIVILRGCDLNTSGPVWTYTPQTHKTAFRGLPRTICLGPKAQEVLKPWLRPNLQETCSNRKRPKRHGTWNGERTDKLR